MIKEGFTEILKKFNSNSKKENLQFMMIIRLEFILVIQYQIFKEDKELLACLLEMMFAHMEQLRPLEKLEKCRQHKLLKVL